MMNSMEKKMCSDAHAVVRKVSKEEISMMLHFLDRITYLSTWKRPLCIPYSINVHSTSPVSQYNTS